MDYSSHRRLLVFLFLKTALVALLQPTAVIANEQSPVHTHYPLDSRGNGVRVVSIAETSDGVLFVGCRQRAQVLVFDGNNWDEVALPSSSCGLVADLQDRVWVSTTDGLGFIQRDALGTYHFHPFDLQEQKSDLIVFPVGFKTDKGIRFGNARVIADIDCSNVEPTATLYRAQPHETFVIKDGEAIYSFFKDKKELFQWKDGDRSVVPTEFLQSGVFACRLPGNRYLFANNKDKEFRIRSGDKWQSFFETSESRVKNVLGRWFQPMSGNRIGFATSQEFVCYDSHGKLLWSVDEEVRRFGELRDGRIWLAGETGFSIVERIDSTTTYAGGLGNIKNINWIDVTEEGVFLSSKSGLFLLELEKVDGAFPKLKHTEQVISDSTAMTWQAGDALLAATTSGARTVRGAAKTNFDKAIIYGFTTSDQHLILSQAGGRSSVLDTEFKHVAEIGLPFDAKGIIEISPTKFWILGLSGRLVVAETGLDFSNCQVQNVRRLAKTSIVKRLDGQLCVLTKDGLFPPELKADPNGVRLLLNLRKPEQRFVLLNEQFKRREIRNAVNCGDFGLLLCGLNYFTMHKLVDGQYQPDPSAEWTIPGRVGNHIAWDPYRSVVWATRDDGIVALLPQQSKHPKVFEPILKMAVDPETSVQARSDEPFEIDAAANISFSYGIPHALGATLFQCRLQGLNEKWSKWTQTSVRNYGRLPSGKYRFQVRARRPNGEVVSVSSREFLAEKAWYATIPAIALFSLLAIGLVFGASSVRSKQLAARNKKMERLIAIRTGEIQKKNQEIGEKSELLVQHYRNAESEKLKSFDTLVAGISHDFNNLLAVISANSELMRLKFGDQAEQLTENMQSAICSAADLCGELSAISDTPHLNLIDDSLRGVVEEVLPLIQGTVAPNVSLDIRFCDQPTGVSINLTEIKRAILNLVVNASEVAKRQILIETSVKFLTQNQLQEARFVGDCPPPGTFACVSIVDDGPGIEPEHLGRLFDPFFSTNELGRGLGLSIVMRVIASHSGVILVDKSELGGACFRLCLPFVEQIEPAMPDPPARVDDSRLKVLVVDDNSMVLESTSIIVEFLGHEVHSAISAAKGFEVLKLVEDINVIVLDISMPVMSGVQMAEILLREFPGFPIVFVSGYSNELIQQDLLQLPNVDFLNKPYRTSALSEKISQVCATRCAGESNPPQPHQQRSSVLDKRH